MWLFLRWKSIKFYKLVNSILQVTATLTATSVISAITVTQYTAVAVRTAFTVSVVQKVVLAVAWSADLADSSSAAFQEQAAIVQTAYSTSSAFTSKKIYNLHILKSQLRPPNNVNPNCRRQKLPNRYCICRPKTTRRRRHWSRYWNQGWIRFRRYCSDWDCGRPILEKWDTNLCF